MNKKSGVTQTQTVLILGIVFLILFFCMWFPFVEGLKKRKYSTQLSVLYSRALQAHRVYSIISSTRPTEMDTSLSLDKFVEKYYAPYFDVDKVCKGNQDGCWNKIQYKDLVNNKLNRISYSLVLSDESIMGFIKDKDGRISYVVDLDGLSGDNKLGHDIFAFYIYNSNTNKQTCEKDVYEKYYIKNGIHFGGYNECGIPHDVLPIADLWGENVVDGCNKKAHQSSFGAGVGAACTAVVRYNNWTIDKNYPW